MAIKIVICVIVGILLTICCEICIKCFSKERKYLKLVNKTLKVVEFFVPNYELTSYTTNVVIEGKTLLFQIFSTHIVIYCKETQQTYVITEDQDINMALEDIRNEIFKHS